MENKFKCSRCQKCLDENEFSIKNEKRTKNCKKCLKFKANWQKEKKNFEFNLKDGTWKEHPEYKGYYASKEGLVVNKKTKKFIGGLKDDGYIQLGLRVPDLKHVYCHNFIWQTFKGEIPDKKIINHINEIKHDNRLDNLELETHIGNTIKSSKKIKGLRQKKPCIGHEVDSKEKIQYKSLNDAGRKTGCCQQSIQKVCDGIYNSCSSKIDNTKWIFKYQS